MIKRFTNPTFALYLAIIISGLKLLIIDSDPPAWGTAYYQPIDELYYVNYAYSLFESSNSYQDYQPHLFGRPILTNIVTYLSLELFGDNYFGLRLSSFIFSIISLVLLYHLLKNVTSNKILLTCLLFYASINFNFWLASILVEPTISRMCTMLLTMYLVVWRAKLFEKPIWIYLLGCISTLMVIITYPTNAFVLLGTCLSLIMISNRLKNKISFLELSKQAILKLTFFALGMGTCILIFLSVSKLIGLNEFSGFQYSVSTFSYNIADSLQFVFANVINIGWGNIFVFSPILLVLLTGSLILSWIKDLSSWSIGLIVSYAFTVAFVLQCFFINDYPQRKLIILLPLILLLIGGVFEVVKKASSELNPDHQKILIAKIWLVFFILTLASLLMPSYTGIFLSPGFLGLLSFVLISGFFILFNFWHKWLTLLGLALIITPEVIKIKDQFLVGRSTYYKEVQIKLREYNGKEFFGGFSMGFRLYNEINTEVNYYEYYHDRDLFWRNTKQMAIANPETTYSIGYQSQKEDYEKIGFSPREVLMKSQQNIDGGEIVIYEEMR